MEVSANGLRVVVTAGAGGAGRVIAETFADQGARVHVCDVDPDAMESLAARRPDLGATVADVGRAEDVDRVFDEALARLGGLDVLVNNAGIAGPTAAAEDTLPADWDRTMAVNISGHFYCARRAIGPMKQAGGGAIINISSTSARTGLPLRIAYAVSKYAVMGLTETLARELGPHGIRVNTILPGGLNNDRLKGVISQKAAATGTTPEALLEEMLQFVSMRTLIEPQEIADMAIFLASDRARHVTGQAIGVCGNVEFER